MTTGRQRRHGGLELGRIGISLLTFAILALAPANPAFAQGTGSPLVPAREAYESAIDVWVVLQQNLAEELRLLPAETGQARLQGTEKARQSVARARLSYLSSLSLHYADLAASFRGPGSAADSTSGQVLSADKTMLSDLDEAVVLLDGEIKSTAATDRPRAAALQKQKTDLLELRSLILRRGRELARLESARTLASGQRESLAKAYARLAEWTSLAAEAAAKEEESWAAAYTAMRGQISNLPREKIVERPAPETAPPPTPPVQIAPAPAQGGGSVLVPSIGGLWLLNNPRAKKLPSGAYEPASARLEINQNGTDVEGSFECTFAVPPNEPFNPVVRFNFTGKITNPILRFEITAPLTGTILLRQADAGTMEVSYGINNPQRTGIAFGAVPEDGPQVLRKALR